MKFIQQAAIVLLILRKERLIQIKMIVVVEQRPEHRRLASVFRYATHKSANLRDDPILLLQKFLVLSVKVVIQPVFDQYLSAVEVILLVIIKAQAVFKIPSSLTRPHRKRVKAAGSGAGSIDTALIFLQKNTRCVCTDSFEHKNRVPLFGERCGLAVSKQHIIRAADVTTTVTQISGQPVNVQALDHDAVFNMAAAMAASAALVCDKFLGTYWNSKGL